MKVKALVSIAGEYVVSPGDIIEMDDAEAKRHIAAGHVQPVRSAAPETATRKAKVEKAVK